LIGGTYANGLQGTGGVRKALERSFGSAIAAPNTASRSNIRPVPAPPGALRRLKNGFWSGSRGLCPGKPTSEVAFPVWWPELSFAAVPVTPRAVLDPRCFDDRV
jgi:hypothetical protein